jgi:murein DD-endopeptidase MepM/ murein hydrolase activator NlpD
VDVPARIWITLVVALAVLPAGHAAATVQPGSYAWPVRGPIIRAYQEPATPYSAGHRGIDIAASFGSPMVASQDGTVAFAGWVAGALYLSIDHPDGVRTTYSWISAVLVKKGDHVARGQIVGNTGHGHPEISTPHLHFGARIGQTYIDPMTLLEPGNVVGLIHLAPLGEAGSSSSPDSSVSTATVALTGRTGVHAM